MDKMFIHFENIDIKHENFTATPKKGIGKILNYSEMESSQINTEGEKNE